MVQKVFDIAMMFSGLTNAFTTSQSIDKTMGNVVKKHSSVTNELTKQTKLSKEQEGALDNILSATPLDGLVRFNQSMVNLNDNMTKIGRQNFGESLSKRLITMGENAKAFSGNLQLIATQGIKGLITGFSALIPVLTAVAAQLAVFAAPIVAAIAVIVAAVFVFKRIWENNVGGIQRFWFKIVGQIQDIWGRFSSRFNQSLRKLGPLVKVLLIGPFTQLMVALKVVSTLIDVMFVAIDPVLDAFNELGKALLEPFDKFNSKGGASINILKSIGDVLGVVAKVLGVIIKVGLTPIVLAVKWLTTLVKIGTTIGKFVGALKPVQAVIQTLTKMWDGFKQGVMSVVSIFEGMFEKLRPVLEILGLIGDKEEENNNKRQASLQRITSAPVAAQQITNNQQRQSTVNNNANITVQSAGAISSDSAPRIGSIIAAQVGFQSKTI